ncbi:hypothetical protein RRG08_042441 [Elysia crispata]|uniref:Uncharacterized protein n=1 Tax=Elysia crispata TaxID=231223 RepID=A0AAE1DEN6_9GAST|nr:hypothetical protein RRG08_042441 [Elysia crispata]
MTVVPRNPLRRFSSPQSTQSSDFEPRKQKLSIASMLTSIDLVVKSCAESKAKPTTEFIMISHDWRQFPEAPASADLRPLHQWVSTAWDMPRTWSSCILRVVPTARECHIQLAVARDKSRG